MSHAKNKLRWCLQKAKKELQEGRKHRGLIEVMPDSERAREHIAKAEHNLKEGLFKNGQKWPKVKENKIKI